MKRVCKEPTTLPGLNRINNTVEIQISQGIGVRHLTETTTEIEDIMGYDALFDSLQKCKRGVGWKSTTGFYVHNWNTELLRMEKELKDGTYVKRPPRLFEVTEPKRREIMSIHFRDRIYIRSLNDNAVYPQITKSLIPDNFACQQGKGTDKTRERLREFMRRFYRQHKTEGFYLQCDIKGYYPNMNRQFSKDVMSLYLDDLTSRLIQIELDYHPGDVGYNPGEQTIQNVGIAALDKMDHFIKERLRIKYYIRYMDDFILVHESRDYLEQCYREIKKYLKNRFMEFNPKKTYIKPITDKIEYLGYIYRLTDTGKVVVLADPKKIKKAKQKIRRLKKLVEEGKRTKHDADIYFKCWKASIRFGNSHRLIENLNKWYIELWKERTWTTEK
jgi:Reverse transcriptase (RNA-dependent DNA polymerase).